MRKTLIVTVLALFVLAIPVFADTSTNSTTAVSQPTNLDEVVIQMLQGVKTAGGEIYDASKSSVASSVEFAQKQAPLVVREFLMWNIAQAVISIVFWSTLAFFILYIGHCFRKQSESDNVPDNDRHRADKENYVALKWVARFAALVILLITLYGNGLTITEITVAPRVFLIQYVVDTIHDVQQH
jgi:predicted PurR-regulated permease PerM